MSAYLPDVVTLAGIGSHALPSRLERNATIFASRLIRPWILQLRAEVISGRDGRHKCAAPATALPR